MRTALMIGAMFALHLAFSWCFFVSSWGPNFCFQRSIVSSSVLSLRGNLGRDRFFTSEDIGVVLNLSLLLDGLGES